MPRLARGDLPSTTPALLNRVKFKFKQDVPSEQRERRHTPSKALAIATQGHVARRYNPVTPTSSGRPAYVRSSDTGHGGAPQDIRN